MPNAQPDLAELHCFFELLYGAIDDGWLVLSSPSATRRDPQGKSKLDSTWHDLSHTSLNDVAKQAAQLAGHTTVYHGCVVQHPTRQPEYWRRGWNASAYQLPGFWFDLDLAYGHHVASALPATDDEALDFLHSLPALPSLILHSGGGLYGWWLFKEPFCITSEDEHRAITQLVTQFTSTLVAAGKQHDWTFDALGDLARVLRPAGSVNYKYGRPVTLLHESGARYNLSDFDWLLPLPQTPRSPHIGTPLGGQPDIVLVAEHYGTVLGKKSATELCGAHPMHGSSTGTNLDVNIQKQLWHCHRHTTGGDAVSLIAVCTGLLDCEQAKPGGLRGPQFWEVVQIARATFGAELLAHTELDNIWGRSIAAQPFTALAQQDATEVSVWP